MLSAIDATAIAAIALSVRRPEIVRATETRLEPRALAWSIDLILNLSIAYA
ncbi:MAG: hypothetical protein Q8M73_12250 [Actinomycetota bacterium]|nr:hypothetical protein [Actinomycetota bacterium]